jgi:protein-histidine N-methyltransferase
LIKEVPAYGEKYSYDEFLYARLLVQSRVFGLHIKGKDEVFFCPYADMLNHNEPPEAKWSYCKKRDGFFMEAIQNIPFGAPIHDSYGGSKETRDIFMSYAFVPYPNHTDDKALYF